MVDRLASVCGPADLSPSDRKRLRTELGSILYVLGRISSGSGFCEDRGYGWGIEQERAGGSDRVFASLRAWPILRRLLPRMRHYRHQTDPVLGLGSVPVDDAVVAIQVVDDQWSFKGRFAEGGDERTIEVVFEAECIAVSDRPVANDVGDRSSDARVQKFRYEGLGNGSFWSDLRSKLPEGDGWKASALAERMQRAVVPCDICGRVVQTLTISGSVLTMTCPGGDIVTSEISGENILPLRRSLAGQDLPALTALNPSWIVGYRADRDASYCDQHSGER